MAERGALLVVGGDSLVGAALSALWRHRGKHVIATTRRQGSVRKEDVWEVDLAREETWPSVERLRESAVEGAAICAAVARLQDCERDPGATRLVNVDGAVGLARRLAEAGVPTVFLSSDKVFDGQQPQRQRADATCPNSEYGRQKAAAEAAMPPSVAVLRLSKIVSPTLALFQGWARDLRAGNVITPFSDLMMAPVPVEAVADAIATLVAERAHGVFQLSGSRDVDYTVPAMAVARCLGASTELVKGRPAGTTPGPVPHTTLAMELEHERWGWTQPDTFTVIDVLARQTVDLISSS